MFFVTFLPIVNPVVKQLSPVFISLNLTCFPLCPCFGVYSWAKSIHSGSPCGGGTLGSGTEILSLIYLATLSWPPLTPHLTDVPSENFPTLMGFIGQLFELVLEGWMKLSWVKRRKIFQTGEAMCADTVRRGTRSGGTVSVRPVTCLSVRSLTRWRLGAGWFWFHFRLLKPSSSPFWFIFVYQAELKWTLLFLVLFLKLYLIFDFLFLVHVYVTVFTVLWTPRCYIAVTVHCILPIFRYSLFPEW